ncbi:hypothetical protein GGI15_000033 [Coemansia interrupta]|uniref:Uncharacterized protein n=1 Tax=Coemansia interrupta TaxID=1126814 RepID=A0A9W8LPV8_9FUNG|nr:hypothetical protein GGI15_000033 [Coemansia interrupta]
MTLASSSSSSLSSTEHKSERYIKRKNEKYINPSTGQVETKHTESKPKQIVESIVNKVKGALGKDKTDEYGHQAGGVSHIPPGNNVNDPMMHHGQQDAGIAANPYGNNQMMNDPMHQRQGNVGQPMNNPMGQPLNNPMGQQLNNPMGQNQNPLGNVAMDNRGPY